MAKKFVLSAQLQLLPPSQSQLSALVTSINRGLRNASANVNINITKGAAQQLTNINNSMSKTTKHADDATSALERFGKSSALAIKRFAAFSIATGGIVSLGVAMKHSFSEAVKFDREMVRIAQVTGKTLSGLTDLSDEITRLSTSFGVSSAKIANVAVTLSQAGISAKDTKTALEVLAKTELSATFEDITDTTEGAIAVMAQFGTSVNELERDLGAINAVSAKFAVESSDLITTVRRTGGAFKAAGGNLNELIALFTSVRSTTRESAESIATGFRTIFTRIQRPKTVEFLKSLGVELRDLKGQFIGPYESIRRLSEALKGIESTDPRFAQIVEELGGFRQVSKVIPLLQQFELSQKALTVAQKANTSITDDAQTAQQALSVKIAKLREEFDALFRTIANNAGIRQFIELGLQLASSLIKVTNSLTPLLPLLVGLGSIKAAQSIGTLGGGFLKEFKKKNSGGPIGFAKGGFVPGSGNRDTVPAMLSPGEFVLRKSAVQALGPKTVAKFNKYANGGRVDFGIAGLLGDSSESDYPIKVGNEEFTAHITAAVISKLQGEALEKKTVRPAVFGAAISSAEALGNTIGAKPKLGDVKRSMRKLDLNAISGQIFEAAIGSLGAPYDDTAGIQDSLDFPRGIGKLSNLFGTDKLATIPTDAKRRIDNRVIRDFKDGKARKYIQGLSGFGGGAGEELSISEIKNRLVKAGLLSPKEAETLKSDSIIKRFKESTKQLPFGFEDLGKNRFKRTGNPGVIGSVSPQRKLFAHGGGVGSDTVPALLTPGEFVVNREAASRIGHNNLSKINKFAKGGVVGRIGKTIKDSPFEATFIASQITGVLSTLGGFSEEVNKVTGFLSGLGIQFTVFNALLKNNPFNKIGDFNKAIIESTRSLRTLKSEREQVEGKRARAQKVIDKFDNLHGPLSANQVTKKTFAEVVRNRSDRRLVDIENERGSLLSSRSKSAIGRKVANIGLGAASVFGAAGGAVGGLLSETGNAEILRSRGASGKGSAVAGGALQGASTGAVLGTAIGTAAAPLTGGLSIPIGTAIGAAIGGLTGFASALEETNAKIRDIKFEDDLQALDDIFKNSARAGKTPDVATVTASAKTLTKQLADLRENNFAGANASSSAGGFKNLGVALGLTKDNPNDDAIKNTKAELSNSLPTLEAFAEKGAREATDVNKYIKDFGELLNAIYAAGGKMPSEFTKLAGSSARINALQAEGIRLRILENQKIEAFGRLSNVLTDFGTELDVISASLDTTSNSFVNVSSILDTIGQNANSTRFNIAAKSVGDTIGGKGGAIVSEQLTFANELAKVLPSLLISSAGDKVGESTGSFADNVSDKIDKMFGGAVNSAAKKEIISNLKLSLHDLFKDEKDVITKDKVKINAKEESEKAIKAAITVIVDTSKKVAELTQAANNKILEAYSKRAELEQKLATGLQGIVDLREESFKTQAGFAERDVTAADVNRFESQRRGAVLGRAGVNSSAEAAARLPALIARRNAEQERLNQGGIVTPEQTKAFAELNNQIDATTKVLEYFANSTRRVSDLQSVLAKETENRKKKESVVEGVAFGGGRERSENLRTLILSAQATQKGTLKGIDPQNQKRILDFLDSLGTSKVFGKGQANDIRKQLAQSVLGAQHGEKTNTEKTIQEQIIEAQKTAEKAQIALSNVTINQITATEKLTAAIIEETNFMKGELSRTATPIGRARGGTIPGYGNSDSVPALLTPGEFVIRKDAAEAIGYDALHSMNRYANGGFVRTPMTGSRLRGSASSGFKSGDYDRPTYTFDNNDTTNKPLSNFGLNNLSSGRGYSDRDLANFGAKKGYYAPTTTKLLERRINKRDAYEASRETKRKAFAGRRKFATGGPVLGGGGGSFNTDGFNAAISGFINSASGLANALNAFPRTIEMSARHTVEVIFNGAEILTRMTPMIQEIAVSEATNAVNKMIKSKMPDIGTM